MAKRLNKQMVLSLTIASMVLTTAAMIVVIMNLPQKDPQPLVREAEQFAKAGNYAEAMKKYQGASRRAKVKKDMPKYAEYMILAGEMALKDGKGAEARKCWSDVILNLPKNESAQQHIVQFLLEFAKYNAIPWSSLQTEAEKLIAINEQNAIGLHALGLALIQQRAAKPENGPEGEKRLIAATEPDKRQSGLFRSPGPVLRGRRPARRCRECAEPSHPERGNQSGRDSDSHHRRPGDGEPAGRGSPPPGTSGSCTGLSPARQIPER